MEGKKMEEHTEDNAIDLDAISEQYEDKSYWKRLKEMLSGLRMPQCTREYKLARIELQR